MNLPSHIAARRALGARAHRIRAAGQAIVPVGAPQGTYGIDRFGQCVDASGNVLDANGASLGASTQVRNGAAICDSSAFQTYVSGFNAGTSSAAPPTPPTPSPPVGTTSTVTPATTNPTDIYTSQPSFNEPIYTEIPSSVPGVTTPIVSVGQGGIAGFIQSNPALSVGILLLAAATVGGIVYVATASKAPTLRRAAPSRSRRRRR